jgi:hypothetical protein
MSQNIVRNVKIHFLHPPQPPSLDQNGKKEAMTASVLFIYEREEEVIHFVFNRN